MDDFGEAAVIESESNSSGEGQDADEHKDAQGEQIVDQIAQSNDSELSAHAVLAKNVEDSIESSAESLSKELEEVK